MMGDYMGCYQDNVLDRAMNGSETYSLGEASSVQICINICGPQGMAICRWFYLYVKCQETEQH